eukprot:m.476690 g.476690  ORF g.476690 m.476690 type:complete len:385 (-) comp20614_c0_seq1:209-1363(-)
MLRVLSSSVRSAARVPAAYRGRSLTTAAVPAKDDAGVEVARPPTTLPVMPLRSGDCMPAIGMGTFTGTRLTQRCEPGTMRDTVHMWLRLGGRMVDCAQNYLNEDEIGDGLQMAIDEGVVTRDDVWITSKLNNPYHRREHVRPALEKTLLDLGVDQLDLYLMHWPTAFKYVPFDPTVRGFPMDYEPDQCSAVTGKLWDETKHGAWPPPHLDRGVTIHETWDAMVDLYKEGLVKNIGVCNFNVMLLNELMCGSDVAPHVVQIESHPFLQQTHMLDFCQRNGIQMQAYSPLGYGVFKGGEEPTVLLHPELKRIGDKHGQSSAAVCLQWHVQRGVATCPMSLRENELRENLKPGSWQLDSTDLDAIARLDLGHHYLRPADWYNLPLWS